MLQLGCNQQYKGIIWFPKIDNMKLLTLVNEEIL